MREARRSENTMVNRSSPLIPSGPARDTASNSRAFSGVSGTPRRMGRPQLEHVSRMASPCLDAGAHRAPLNQRGDCIGIVVGKRMLIAVGAAPKGELGLLIRHLAELGPFQFEPMRTTAVRCEEEEVRPPTRDTHAL